MEITPNNQWQPRHPGRRQGERRVGDDRRDMIRFEPDKTDRRSGQDRRQPNRDSWGRGEPI